MEENHELVNTKENKKKKKQSLLNKKKNICSFAKGHESKKRKIQLNLHTLWHTINLGYIYIFI